MSDADFDLVIRGGNIVDGSGDDLFEGDVAIKGRVIAAVGKVSGRGREEIDAKGKLVTPGFVDVHTHYDGQVTWGHDLSPSSQNGVTTTVMGNCGVGFAPCRPGDRDRLVRLMEGVEDIPEPVLAAGLPWTWETFPEYMDWLSGRQFDIDFAAQLPHAAARVYVMGERGARREPATIEDNAQMAEITRKAMRAGALGFTTSRTINHRTSDGDFTPTLKAGEEELMAVTQAMRAEGHGVLQFVLDRETIDEDLPMLLRVGKATGCPINLTVVQDDKEPDRWRQTMDDIAGHAAGGHAIHAQVAARPIGLILGLELSRMPFLGHPSYREIMHLPLVERVARMRDPEMRARILSEEPIRSDDPLIRKPNYNRVFRLGSPPDYEQSWENALGPVANAQGRDPAEMAYDALLENDGRGMLYVPFVNYKAGNLDVVREMMLHPNAVPGLSDGGAHCGIICDASFPTYLLTHWTRDRSRGEKLSIPFIVAAQTRRTAASVGLHDRGVLKPGYKADVNVIDYDRLSMSPPLVHYDLPEGGRRLVQSTTGYDATIVSGVMSRRKDEATGALPGRLVRGVQTAPNQ
ncbi:MAG: amidohydrolase family protein [Pseudomonadota bacterium]